MKIYFGASVSGKKLYLTNYLKIIEVIRELGHEAVYDNFFKTSVEEVQHQTLEQKMKVHQNLGTLKLKSDLILMEVSYRSFALGQEIAHAFRIGKPVLALYTDGQVPHFILSDAGDRLLVSEYTMDSLKQKIVEGVAFLNPHETKRFTMNMPASIVDFLDKVSRENNTTRSDYIRSLIQSEMHNVRSKKV